MYLAIVFLPLLGCILAGAIAIVGAHTRFPGGETPHGAEDTPEPLPLIHHPTHEEHPQEPAAMGSRSAEVITTALLFIAMVFSWISFVQVGFGRMRRSLSPASLRRAISRSNGRCTSTR